jgi:hypothetical protein
MKELLPDARLIVMVRNPIDRAYSHYWHNRSRSREDRSFEDALAYESGLADGDRMKIRYGYVSRGMYAARLKRVLELYPQDRLHVIVLDDMSKDPVGVFRRTCTFLGISDEFPPSDTNSRKNAFLGVRSSAVLKLWTRVPRPLARVVRHANATGERYPEMRDATRKQLAGLYAEDVGALGAMLGRDLSGWLDVTSTKIEPKKAS